MKEFKYIGNTIQPVDYARQITENGSGKRMYATPSGVIYPSITTILNILSEDHLQKWRKRIGDKEADRIGKYSRERGDVIHDMVEKYLKNQDPKDFLPQDPMLKILFKQMRPYLDKIDLIEALETPLYSDKFKLAGRCDCIATYDGITSVIDFKGSGKEKKESWIKNYYIQASFYAAAYFERTGIWIPQIVIMITGEEGGTQIFKEKPWTWWDDLNKVRKLYKEREGI